MSVKLLQEDIVAVEGMDPSVQLDLSALSRAAGVQRVRAVGPPLPPAADLSTTEAGISAAVLSGVCLGGIYFGVFALGALGR